MDISRGHFSFPLAGHNDKNGHIGLSDTHRRRKTAGFVCAMLCALMALMLLTRVAYIDVAGLVYGFGLICVFMSVHTMYTEYTAVHVI